MIGSQARTMTDTAPKSIMPRWLTVWGTRRCLIWSRAHTIEEMAITEAWAATCQASQGPAGTPTTAEAERPPTTHRSTVASVTVDSDCMEAMSRVHARHA